MKNQAVRLVETVQKLREYALTLSLAGYVAGFIITSIHLGRYGVVNFDVVRAHYVLCGVMFLLFTFTCLYPSYVAWKVFENNKINAPFKNVATMIFISIIGNLIILMAVYMPFYFFEFTENKTTIPTVFIATSIALVLLNSVLVLFSYVFVSIVLRLPKNIRDLLVIETTKKEKESDFDFYFNTFTPISTIIFLFLFIILSYSYFVYPQMPQYLGGGKAVPVEVSFASETSMQHLYLLDRTADTIIFVSENCTTNKMQAKEISSDEIISIAPIDENIPVCPPTPTIQETSTPTLIPNIDSLSTFTPTPTERTPHGRP